MTYTLFFHRKKKQYSEYSNSLCFFFSLLFISLFFSYFSSFFLISSSSASVPNEMIYEGRMLSHSGMALQGNYEIRFSFWKTSDFTNSSLNSDGSINTLDSEYSQWQEVIPIDFEQKGYFSAILGRTQSLEDFPFTLFKYLQVEIKKTTDPDTAYQLLDINGDNGVDTIDRKIIGSVPYAKNAHSAENSTDSSFVIDPNNTINNAGVGSISLEFGTSLSHFLQYDIANQNFIFSDDVEIQGELKISQQEGSLTLSADMLTGEREVLFPDEDITVVGENSNQEITNKTIDANKNTLLNISTAAFASSEQHVVFFPDYPSFSFFTESLQKFTSLYLQEVNGQRFYKISSHQATLQEGIVKTAVFLPKFSDFSNGLLSLDLKTTSANSTDNSFKIEIKDKNNIVIATQIGIVTNGNWETSSVVIPSTFIPDDNVIFVEITALVTDINPVYIGKLDVQYLGQ